MSDPIWDKVRELTEGYHPAFNVSPVYDMVKNAWRMGFDVVRDPNGPERLRVAQAFIARQMSNADGWDIEITISRAAVNGTVKTEGSL